MFYDEKIILEAKDAPTCTTLPPGNSHIFGRLICEEAIKL